MSDTPVKPLSAESTAAAGSLAGGQSEAIGLERIAHICLVVGGLGLAFTLFGLIFGDEYRVGLGALIGATFWFAIAMGMLFLVMLSHLFDAGWSIIIRRHLEHGISVFPWLAAIFFFLFFFSMVYGEGGIIWKWMSESSESIVAGEVSTVGDDLLWHVKQPYLDNFWFIFRNILYFAIFISLAWALRRNSFQQDTDGDPKHSLSSRKWSAYGVIAGALAGSFAALDWMMTLDFHWFSTIYGVWFFATSVRGALAITVLIMLFMVRKGVLAGIFKQAHLHDLGKLTLAFTMFWAYISFSQFFLIYNANIPEVGNWYVMREGLNWQAVGFALLFGYFLFPFLMLLMYRTKINPGLMTFFAIWILCFMLLDIYFNILPSKMDDLGESMYAFIPSFWDLTALVGVGGICAWSYLRSFAAVKPIPVRDPRILESLHHHE
ncbi:MAG: hypothetical protein JJT75_03175 [Opitutales bacterium]|nr:hypothetical protein [Opitutales bacterium]